jgi:hypothetical protein
MLRVGYIFLLLLQSQVEAGGVPALAARGVPEQMEIKVPSDKVDPGNCSDWPFLSDN